LDRGHFASLAAAADERLHFLGNGSRCARHMQDVALSAEDKRMARLAHLSHQFAGQRLDLPDADDVIEVKMLDGRLP
jgi:hypothetical protein